MPLSHPYTAAKVALVFMRDVFKLHGLPRTIVSDRVLLSLLISRKSCSNFLGLN